MAYARYSSQVNWSQNTGSLAAVVISPTSALDAVSLANNLNTDESKAVAIYGGLTLDTAYSGYIARDSYNNALIPGNVYYCIVAQGERALWAYAWNSFYAVEDVVTFTQGSTKRDSCTLSFTQSDDTGSNRAAVVISTISAIDCAAKANLLNSDITNASVIFGGLTASTAYSYVLAEWYKTLFDKTETYWFCVVSGRDTIWNNLNDYEINVFGPFNFEESSSLSSSTSAGSFTSESSLSSTSYSSSSTSTTSTSSTSTSSRTESTSSRTETSSTSSSISRTESTSTSTSSSSSTSTTSTSSMSSSETTATSATSATSETSTSSSETSQTSETSATSISSESSPSTATSETSESSRLSSSTETSTSSTSTETSETSETSISSTSTETSITSSTSTSTSLSSTSISSASTATSETSITSSTSTSSTSVSSTSTTSTSTSTSSSSSSVEEQVVENIRTYKDGNAWMILWDGLEVPGYAVYIDGSLYTVTSDTSIIIPSSNENMAVQIVPSSRTDAAYEPAIVPNIFQENKIKIIITPPTPRTGIQYYRIYWDRGEGTVYCTSNYLLGTAPDDGVSATFSYWTPELVSGTYKFVTRSVDAYGNEDTNIVEQNYTLVTYPGTITNLQYRWI